MINFILSAFDRKGNSKASLQQIWRVHSKIGNYQPWRSSQQANRLNEKWSLEETMSQSSEQFKGFKSTTINVVTVTLTKEAGFVEADEDNVEEVLASHDQQLIDEELMQLQE